MAVSIEQAAAAAYAANRALLPRVNVRHNGREYYGTAARTLDQQATDTTRGVQDVTSGAVRLLVSELGKPAPAEQDEVFVQTESGGAYDPRRVKLIRKERNGCIIVEYGATYG
jgi:hypothetical protein